METGAAMVRVAFLIGLALVFGGLASAQSPLTIDLPSVPGKDTESAIGTANDAARIGVATFIFTDDIEPWAALVVNAGTPDGIDRVTVSLSTDTKALSIEAEDGVPTNLVTLLVNKDFIETYVESDESSLSIEVSEGVNYQGVTSSVDAGGAEVYVFVITHFSVQYIEISPTTSDIGTILGADGLTAMGWALITLAVVIVLLAATVALRKRH